MQIGEVATAAAGNPDFFGRFCRMIDNYNRTAALSGFDCTHKAGGTGTNHKDINLLHAAGQSFGENDLPYTDKLACCQRQIRADAVFDHQYLCNFSKMYVLTMALCRYSSAAMKKL